MSRTIYNSWRDFRVSFSKVLTRASSEICIFDDDLDQTGFTESVSMEILRVILYRNPLMTIRIALRDTSRLKFRHPRLMQLLKTHCHAVQIQEVIERFVPRRDCMIIVDGDHAVVRFDLSLPRCKLVLDDPVEVEPYHTLFNSIWETPSRPLSTQTLGL